MRDRNFYFDEIREFGKFFVFSLVNEGGRVAIDFIE